MFIFVLFVFLENFDNFRKWWNIFFIFEEMNRVSLEIDCLMVYIRKGCLFGLKFGEGIELNERFYNILNKLLLCGVIIIGFEIVIVIISFIFYVINCKKCGKKYE